MIASTINVKRHDWRVRSIDVNWRQKMTYDISWRMSINDIWRQMSSIDVKWRWRYHYYNKNQIFMKNLNYSSKFCLKNLFWLVQFYLFLLGGKGGTVLKQWSRAIMLSLSSQLTPLFTRWSCEGWWRPVSRSGHQVTRHLHRSAIHSVHTLTALFYLKGARSRDLWLNFIIIYHPLGRLNKAKTVSRMV